MGAECLIDLALYTERACNIFIVTSEGLRGAISYYAQYPASVASIVALICNTKQETTRKVVFDG